MKPHGGIILMLDWTATSWKRKMEKALEHDEGALKVAAE